MNNDEKHEVRLQIEAISNFLKKQPETATKQLGDSSKSENLGDPISDVKMNQKANEQGSDGKNAPTVSVTPGSKKGGSGPDTGQATANFKDKTTLAENDDLITGDQLRDYIAKALQEHFANKVESEESLEEGAADELIGAPTKKEEGSEENVDEMMSQNHSAGRMTHAKPKGYPDQFKRR